MAERENTIIDDIHSKGLDVKNRRVYFGVMDDSSNGEFSWHSVELAVRNIHMLVALDAKQPIELHMNSIGGDLLAMLRLHDEILNCSCPIKFIGGGTICSCAAFIMASCDERIVHKNTEIMLHFGGTDISGHTVDTNIYMDQYKRNVDILIEILVQNSRMPHDFWKSILQRDIYLSASEAVSLGLVDTIIEPRKRGNLRRVRLAQLQKHPSKREMSSLVNEMYSRIYKDDVRRIEIRMPQEKFEDVQDIEDLSSKVDFKDGLDV